MARLIDGDVSSSVNIRQVRQRLDKCLSSHGSCRQRISHIQPPRFLDVNLPEPGFIKLRSLDATRQDSYAALSYCWGTDQPIKTTLASLASHEASISIESLPQTIQHAIDITRELH